MGSPQRQPPVPPEQRPRNTQSGPQLENLRSGKVEREVSSGWRFGFWWVWVLVIVGIWYVGYGWGGHGGWLRSRPAAVQNDTQLSGQGTAMLDANNKASFANQAFSLRNVEVERRASDRALWIGSKFNAVPTLLILPAGNDRSIAAIGQGAWIDTTGRIYAAPKAEQAKQQWGLSDQDAQQLEQQGAYMQATGVQQVPH